MGWFSDKQETIMKKTYHTTEQIIRILREAETSGQSNEEVCRQRNISPQTFYHWKSKYEIEYITSEQLINQLFLKMLSHPHRADSNFARWQKFLRLHEWNRKSQGSIAPVAERLQRFPFAHDISKQQDILDSVPLLSQGHALLQAALGDSLGYSSSDGRKLNNTRKARLTQWRLVMAFSGFETLSKGLILPRQRDWNKPRFGEFIREMDGCLGLSKTQPLAILPPPGRGNRMQLRFFEASHLKEGGAMARLLNLNPHDIQLLAEWIEGKTALNQWDERLRLAKTFRNCTAHGVLSAHKACEFGFVPAFKELAANLGSFTDAIFSHLIK